MLLSEHHLRRCACFFPEHQRLRLKYNTPTTVNIRNSVGCKDDRHKSPRARAQPEDLGQAGGTVSIIGSSDKIHKLRFCLAVPGPKAAQDDFFHLKSSRRYFHSRHVTVMKSGCSLRESFGIEDRYFARAASSYVGLLVKPKPCLTRNTQQRRENNVILRFILLVNENTLSSSIRDCITYKSWLVRASSCF